MKFCKNLQRVADLSNPEWSPYWTDYKRLKKIIKSLSGLDINGSDEEEQRNDTTTIGYHDPPAIGRVVLINRASGANRFASIPSSESPSWSPPKQQQRQGDATTETASIKTIRKDRVTGISNYTTAPSADPATVRRKEYIHRILQSPGEVQFFKVLHFEFNKAVHFFDQTYHEFAIREERVNEGVELVKKSNRDQLWRRMATSVYKLYTDLLLLESFCIMTYCGFSKILKKHDKVTGLQTKTAFMVNVVNNANFSNYSGLEVMIARCETLYSEVSGQVASQQGDPTLYEDEKLFIDMINKLNGRG